MLNLYSVKEHQVNLPPFDAESTEMETIVFLAELLKFMHPRIIVEAGTYNGHFALTVVQVLSNCVLHTCDPRDRSVTYEDGSKGTIGSFIDKQGPNFHFYQEDFEDMLKRLEKRSIHFAFIDSGPVWVQDPAEAQVIEKEMRLRHYRAVHPYMATGGLIAVHDTNAKAFVGCDEITNEAGLILRAGRGLTIKQVRR